ncbi:MAG: glucoamylase family protein, partial [Bacillota bacterium]
MRALTNQLNCANEYARHAQEKGTETAAQQWLIGNSILLQRTLQRLKTDLPKHRSLPAEYDEAKVLVMAREWIDSLDGRLDREALLDLCEKQFEKAPLTVTELDALGDALALALMEQIVIIASIGNTKEKRWSKAAKEPDDAVVMEQGYLQRQAQLDYRMAVLIQNLQALEDLDVERLCAKSCPADVLLREDEVFMRMDRGSRGVYRLAVAKKAIFTGRSEEEVVQAALRLAKTGEEPFAKEVGYYLLDHGQAALHQALGDGHIKESTYEQKEKWVVAGICAITFAAVIPLFWILPAVHALWVSLLVLPLSQNMAQEIVRRIASRYGTHTLCALDFSKEIPDEYATAVVMPVLLTSPQRARDVAQSLEALYLGNRSDRLSFILLGDYKDAEAERLDGDAAIAREAKLCIRELNAKYGTRFFYLQRPRRLHERDGIYMGRERKRGALSDLTRLLTAGETDDFENVDEALLKIAFRYMLTLDADTQMQPGGAHKLIGALAHPLNRAYTDKDGHVARGYGIMQPIVRTTLSSAAKTVFSRSFSAQAGVDAYASASSDAWFRCLGRSAFTGKGLIDLDVYSRAACKVLPDGVILSHDLIEGALCRVALCDRVQVLDGCPPKYLSWAKREHRWMRGDWQLLPFLFARLPISGIDRLRMADNLLRSLKPVALLALFFAGALLRHANLVLYALILWSAPFWIMLLVSPFSLLWRDNRCARIRTLAKSSLNWLSCLAFDFVMLAQRAFLSVHAIVCALYRRFISKRRLFEWVTAADAEAASPNAVYAYLLSLWQGPVAAVLLCVAQIGWWPIAAVWAVSPLIAWAASREIRTDQSLNRDERLRLGVINRKTWDYFVRLVNEDTHHLPPDNYQFAPKPGPALRTSPTNIGYALLANLCAAHLTYIGWEELCARTENTLATLEALESYRGHLYNWYDIRTLTPLCPRYISTVDCGNLACAMMTLRQALEVMPDEPFSPQRILQGIMHALVADTENENHGDGAKTVLKRALTLTHTRFKEDTHGLCALRERLGALEELLGADEVGYPRAHKQVRDAISELDALMPWLSKCPAEAKKHAEVMDRLNSVRGIHDRVADAIALLTADAASKELCGLIWEGRMAARERLQLYGPICERLTALIDRMDFSVLYDEERELMYIGMDGEGCAGKAHYDLWTSEARLTSLVAMAKGEVPFDHYRRLGRVPTRYKSCKTLLSWSGTMFEYLMTRLFVPDAPGSLGETVNRGAVRIQRAYARRLGLPFGMSESGYYAFDRQLNYQYKAFGVPNIGFKSGLIRERVIAPYASAMAAMVDAHVALENMERLEREGAKSPFGFYEALDYTKERIGEDKELQIIKSAMVHHQGMILCALTNVLEGDALQKWFMRDPGMRALSGLLEERNIDTWPKALHKTEEKALPTAGCALPGRVVKQVGTAQIAHLLSGGSYHVRLTATGGGMSTLGNIALNRWRNDPVLDEYGMRVHVRLPGQKAFCAMPGVQDTLNREEAVEFFPHLARFVRSRVSIRTELEVFVCPEPDAEVRMLTIENTSNRTLEIEVTCAFEPVLCRIE